MVPQGAGHVLHLGAQGAQDGPHGAHEGPHGTAEDPHGPHEGSARSTVAGITRIPAAWIAEAITPSVAASQAEHAHHEQCCKKHFQRSFHMKLLKLIRDDFVILPLRIIRGSVHFGTVLMTLLSNEN